MPPEPGEPRVRGQVHRALFFFGSRSRGSNRHTIHNVADLQDFLTEFAFRRIFLLGRQQKRS